MFEPPYGKPWLLYVLLGSSLALNVVMVIDRISAGDGTPEVVSAIDAAAENVDALEIQAATSEVEGAATAAASAPSAEPAIGALETAGWTVLRGEVEHSLARTFQREAGEDGDALSSVFARLFVWDLDMRRDLQAGDSVAVAWRSGPDGVPEVAAASLQSRKLAQTLTAYRWQAPGDAFASYWRLDGAEVPLRLQNGPIDQYEQITSLLKDRPTHKGMDFKTPVGTEVRAPRAGTVTRVNWNWTANGNCLEVRYDDGVMAKFLHLSENQVTDGARLSAGQVIALTGNTGHSTAPHLHYELERNGKTLDPLDYHGTERRSLNADQVAALQRDIAGFENVLRGLASR